jgi:hypothetical protein
MASGIIGRVLCDGIRETIRAVKILAGCGDADRSGKSATVCSADRRFEFNHDQKVMVVSGKKYVVIIANSQIAPRIPA